MKAIFKREFRSYMNNVIGPVIIALLLIAAGVMITFNNVLLGSAHFEYSMSMMQLALIVAIPVLAMHPVAEERKSRVDRWMRSLPIRPISIVLGRYAAALCVFAIACAVLAVYPIVLGMVGLANAVSSYTAIVGFFLLGAALLALCSFTSALTSSPVIAVLLGIGGVLALHLPDLLVSFAPVTGAFARFLPKLSLMTRYSIICSGVFEWSSVLTYLSFTVFFLALTWLVVSRKHRA